MMWYRGNGGSAGAPKGERRPLRRRLVALAAAGAAALGLVVVAGPVSTATAAAAPVRDGSTSALAAPSCWAIKQQSPSSPSGIYWLQTAKLIDPQQFYCDQTTDGGGWVLVGRGREGWNWGYSGQGLPSAVRNTPSGTAAFDPATVGGETVDGLLDGGRTDALPDGIRVVRALNTQGSQFQETRIFLNNQAKWTWSFGGGIVFKQITIAGVNRGSGNTQSFPGDSRFNALVTTQSQAHNWNYGWGFGSQIAGANSATSYLWSYTTERNALPFTQVWLRPKITSTSFSPIPASGTPASTIRPMVSDRTSPTTPWGVTGVHGVGEAYVEVESMAQIGNRMYVGGDFSFVQKGPNPGPGEKIAQSYVAAFDVNTGEWISSFRPVLDGTVWDLQALPNGELAVGGQFTHVNGEARTALAILDPDTGATESNFVTTVSSTNATSTTPAVVKAMDVQGNWLYLGGRFNRVSGGIANPLNNVIVGRMARVSLTDGRPDGTWKPNFDGTIVEVDASQQGDRVYTVGYFTTVNGASSPNEATISTSGNGDLVPGLGQWKPSAGSSSTAKYQQDIKESDDGWVWQGGSEHILEQFDRATYTMKRSFITKNGNAGGGGDIQSIAIVNGVVYASCHCVHYVYSDDLNWGSAIQPTNTGVNNINFIGAWDAVTGDYIPSWWPSALDGRIAIGPWEMIPDTNGCLWFGGDMTRGSFNNATGGYQWLGGFGKFCQNDSTAPTRPASLNVTSDSNGANLSWPAATDNSGGTITYEILRNDRVIATTTSRSYTDTTVTYPATYFVRAMDASGNRSASTAGVDAQGPDTTPPSTPTGLTATALSAVSAQLSWNAADDDRALAGYRVSRNGTVLPGLITSTSFTDTGLIGGSTYTYTVIAVDAAGNTSPASQSASVTTPVDNPVVFSDTWAGNNGDPWQAAWTTNAVSGSVTTTNNTGVLAFDDVSGAYARAQLTGPQAQADGTVLMSYRWNSTAAAAFLNVWLRGSGGWQNSYRPKTGYGIQLQSNSGTASVQKNVNGVNSTLQNLTGAQQVTTAKQWLRVQVNGSTIQFKTWLDGQPEPATWKTVVTDSTVTGTGQVFVSLNRGGSTNVGAKSVAIDDLQLLNS